MTTLAGCNFPPTCLNNYSPQHTKHCWAIATNSKLWIPGQRMITTTTKCQLVLDSDGTSRRATPSLSGHYLPLSDRIVNQSITYHLQLVTSFTGRHSIVALSPHQSNWFSRYRRILPNILTLWFTQLFFSLQRCSKTWFWNLFSRLRLIQMTPWCELYNSCVATDATDIQSFQLSREEDPMLCDSVKAVWRQWMTEISCEWIW